MEAPSGPESPRHHGLVLVDLINGWTALPENLVGSVTAVAVTGDVAERTTATVTVTIGLRSASSRPGDPIQILACFKICA